MPEVVVLPDTVDDPSDPFAWLAFDGRWGERQAGVEQRSDRTGRQGRWTEPVDWHEGLRDSRSSSRLAIRRRRS